ncbi:MAG: hypothetical protein RAK25_02455 [TACK group archaeon]|nr:hypothetical protein [TACK group archaeon]
MEIYYHPSCISSYNLIKGLESAGYLEAVHLINTAQEFQDAMEKGVISVPYVFVGGRPMLVDPVTYDEVIDLFEGKKRASITIDQAAQNFVKSVSASAFAATACLLRGSFRPLLSGGFPFAASKVYLHGYDFRLGELLTYINDNDARLFEESRDHLIRSVAYNLMRISFWSGSEDDLDDLTIKMLLLARGSLGRVAIPYPPDISNALVKSIGEALAERGEKYLEMLKRERETILSDEKYKAFL